ncbi:glycosyltransferase family 4 protein [Methanococcoides sp. LMO-2]|uniref:Glycosyltransferase family 4 protein n=1 Tax=Methanococcoides cohabitans TaxID=3136559 RepID=A0ABU9KX94_9EURY
MKSSRRSFGNDQKQISKKGLIIFMETKASYSIVQSSRALHVFQELKKYLPDTYLMLQKNEQNEVVLENLIQVKPIIPIAGKLSLLKGISFRFQMSMKVFHFLLTKKIDYVIIRGYDCIVLYPFLRLLNTKIYYDFHGKYHLELYQRKRILRGYIAKFSERVLLKNSDRIIVVSAGVKEQIKEYAHKCIYLPNGVDVGKIESNDSECPLDIPKSKKVIGFIGNWEQVMKIDDICDSVDYLKDVVVVIVGQGYDYKKIFAKYGQKENVILTGRLEYSSVMAILKRMDVCIVPYNKDFYMSKLKDFFSNRKISEYLAAGKPMVIADIEGIPGHLKENVNYVKYESGNPKSLADRVEYLFSDPELRTEMSQNNKILAKEFDWEQIVLKSGILEDL